MSGPVNAGLPLRKSLKSMILQVYYFRLVGFFHQMLDQIRTDACIVNTASQLHLGVGWRNV